jgi:hypothetical protein
MDDVPAATLLGSLLSINWIGVGDCGTVPAGNSHGGGIIVRRWISCCDLLGMGTGEEWWTTKLEDTDRRRGQMSNIGLSGGDCSKLSVREGLI